MTLTEFLLARIAEDEVVALSVQEVTPKSDSAVFTSLDKPTGTVEVSPARVLAEVRAKRRIIEEYEVLRADYRVTHDPTTEARRFQALVAIGLLAAAYSSHPDYDEAWRP